ncbi:hypothetical protein BC834DRAFT_908802, partial [Gloeopeniophorella convolvens]
MEMHAVKVSYRLLLHIILDELNPPYTSCRTLPGLFLPGVIKVDPRTKKVPV